MLEVNKPKLLDRVRATARMRHLSLRTEDAYVARIRQFILFHQKRHPAEMGADEIAAYLTHLAVNDHVAASTQNVALCALLFLYRDVMQVELPQIQNVHRAQQKTKLPVVFSRAEVKQILAQLRGVDDLMARLRYGPTYRRRAVVTRCATRLRLICSKAVTIFAPFKSCSDTKMFARRWFIRTFSIAADAACEVCSKISFTFKIPLIARAV